MCRELKQIWVTFTVLLTKSGDKLQPSFSQNIEEMIKDTTQTMSKDAYTG